jgi:hypothetical protein
MLRDQIALVSALGYRSTAMIVGHDGVRSWLG